MNKWSRRSSPPAAAAGGAPLRLLLGARLRGALNLLARWREESLLKISVVLVAGVVFWAGLFALFNRWFSFMRPVARPFQDVLMAHVLSLFFLTLFLLLAFSNAVISLTSLFRSEETGFLFALPVRPETTFVYKTLESLTFSSWAFFVLGLPLLAAYGRQWDAPPFYYVMMLVTPVPFVIAAAGIGSLTALLATRVLPRRRGWALAAAGAALVAVGAVIAWSVVAERWKTGNPIMDVDVIEPILGKLRFVRNFYTPNYWAARSLTSLTTENGGGVAESLHFFCVLCTTALFVVVLGRFIAGLCYPQAYASAATLRSTRRRAGRGLLERLLVLLPDKRLTGTVIALKDMKTFLRDPTQWSQVLIFFGLLAVYIANLRNFRYPLEDALYRNMISFLNLGAICLTLATLAGRFAFPLISLEGQRFWILGLAPVKRREVLYAKFVFFFLFSLVVTGGLVLLSNWVLRCDPTVLVLQTATAGMLSVGLSGLAVGLGALFPNLKERNPSKIISGFGGTLTLLLAVGLVVLPVALSGLICHDHFVMHDRMFGGEFGRPWLSFEGRTAVLLAGTAVFSGAAAIIPLYFGGRALERMEF